MTKEEYENYNGLLYCKTCNRFVPKKHINHKRVFKDGTISKCNVDFWIERHNGIPKINGFTDLEIKEYLYEILYEDPCILNNLCDKINKTLDEIIRLHKSLNIKGKHVLVKSNCKNCGKEIFDFPSVYSKNKNFYCSYECYLEDKPNTILKGNQNQFYNRVTTSCTNCGKEIYVIPYNYNKQNHFGDNHNFCSQECYWDYRSKYYIGEKSVGYQRDFTEEQRNKRKKYLLDSLYKDDRLDTSIQIKVNKILDKNKIKYQREQIFDYYAVDNYLVDNNGVIEVMGDYWHSNPLRYNQDKYLINETQRKQLHRDKIKYSYIHNHYNINILYLWETDINTNIDLCENLILKYINNNCNLENYHSFNWSNSNNLMVKDNIIIPYQDMPVNQYRHLIKQIS